MQKYANSVQDTNGNARASASVTVYLTGTTTKATLYSDNAASPTSLANPVTTNALGEFYFYAASGRYDLSISGTGFTTQSLTDIQLFDGPDPTGAANVGFSPTGTGALTTRTVQAALRAMVRTGDYDTVPHYQTAFAALTEKSGVAELNTTVIDSQSGTSIKFKTQNGQTQFEVIDQSITTGWWSVQGDPGTGGPRLACTGTGTDIHGVICSKGAAPVIICTGGASSLTQLEVVHTASVGNVVAVTGCTSNNSHGVQVTGAQKTSGDTAVNIGINTLGVGKVIFESNALLVGTTAVPTAANAAHITIGPTLSLTAGTSQFGIQITAVGNSDATGVLNAIDVTPRTAAAAFTCSTVSGVMVNDTVKGAGSAITLLQGIRVADLTAGVSNVGYRGLLSSGSNKFNLYMDGTAQNYLAGLTGIGTVPTATSALSLPASTTGVSSFNAPHGSAPSSPVNGDVWTTTAGLFIRINGVTKTVTLT